MSGHSKWSSIKHKKAKIDAKKGRIFSRLSKEIILAAKLGGADVEANPRLRTAVNAARNVNMPSDNIERAIKKGAGQLEGQVMEEFTYEAYAPGGIGVIIDCLTDNRNRSAADIRHLLTRGNAKLANSGAVSMLFHRKARFLVEGEKAQEDALMELFFNAGVDIDDIHMDEGSAEIIAPPEAFDAVVKVLEGAGIVPTESGVARIPQTTVPVADVKTAQHVISLLESLEEYDDVQNVYANAAILDDVVKQLAAEK